MGFIIVVKHQSSPDISLTLVIENPCLDKTDSAISSARGESEEIPSVAYAAFSSAKAAVKDKRKGGGS